MLNLDRDIRGGQGTVARDVEPITLNVSRTQAWAMYDLLVAKAEAIEANETAGRCDLGSGRYRSAANEIKIALER